MANPGLIKTYDTGYISAPTQSAPATATTGGTLAAGTYYYVVTATGIPASWPPSSAGVIGETVASSEQSITTTGSTSENTINYVLPAGATGGYVYRGSSAGGENVRFPVAAGSTSFVDTGAAGSPATPPVVNTAAFLFPAYSVVKFSTSTDFQVLPATSPTDPLAGVLTEVAANSGERVDVVHTQVAYVLSGGTINAGDPLTVNANSAAVTASSGNRCFGIARQSAVAGDVFEAIITFFTQH